MNQRVVDVMVTWDVCIDRLLEKQATLVFASTAWIDVAVYT